MSRPPAYLKREAKCSEGEKFSVLHTHLYFSGKFWRCCTYYTSNVQF